MDGMVEQRDVPGIDCAHLAMDTEEGVEVVWNEVQFSERKNFKLQEEKIQLVFENLTQLEHPNIVKFHRYWTDTHNDKPRVIFITEYMSSGSLKQFLKRTKKNVKKLPLQAWKRWLSATTTAIDVYSFGICALEMAALEIQGNGDSGTLVTDEHIRRTVESLEDTQQKDFINKCLSHDPAKRPSARELLFHSLLFEVHTLKLLSAHCLVNTSSSYDDVLQRIYKPDILYAEICRPNNVYKYHLGDIVATEKLDKFIEDVKYGIYPLTAFSAQKPPSSRPRALSPETAESVKSATPEPLDIETRRVVNMICSVKPRDMDREKIATMIDETLRNHQLKLNNVTETVESTGALTTSGSVAASGSMPKPPLPAGASPVGGGGATSSIAGKSNHLHHHVPVHSASLERGWKVADTESMPSTMPAIVETSGVSVNSMIDGGNFAGHLDDAEEARENDEELEALERMVELRRFSREEAQATLVSNDFQQHDKIVPAENCTPPNVLHRAGLGAAETTDRNNTNRTSSTGAGYVNNVEPVASSKPIKP
uniref:Protein kinase domain-containing protein n=1 Tax=Anopheles quadriannulatus TaxID=34691 RepID=A0A182WT13_ANOQN